MADFAPTLSVVRAPARPEPVLEPSDLEEEARFLAVEEIPPSYDGAEPVANYFGGAAPSEPFS